MPSKKTEEKKPYLYVVVLNGKLMQQYPNLCMAADDDEARVKGAASVTFTDEDEVTVYVRPFV
jgi:hypothetical protein